MLDKSFLICVITECRTCGTGAVISIAMLSWRLNMVPVIVESRCHLCHSEENTHIAFWGSLKTRGTKFLSDFQFYFGM